MADFNKALGDIRGFFDTLVPPTSNKITDIFGEEYNLRTVIPGKTQILLARQIESVELPDGLIPKNGMTMDGIANGLVRAASSQKNFDMICGIVKTCHPQLEAQVRARHAEPKDESDTLGTCNDIGEMFAIEDMVGSVLPFFIRLLAKASALMKTATSEQAADQGASNP